MTRRLIQLFLAAALIGGAASEARAADEIARRGAYTVGASGDLDGMRANHPLNPTKKNFGAACFPFTPGSSVDG